MPLLKDASTKQLVCSHQALIENVDSIILPHDNLTSFSHQARIKTWTPLTLLESIWRPSLVRHGSKRAHHCPPSGQLGHSWKHSGPKTTWFGSSRSSFTVLNNTLAIVSLFREPITLPRDQGALKRLHFHHGSTHQGIDEARLRYQQANVAYHIAL